MPGPQSPICFRISQNRLEERNLKNYKDSDYALNKFSEGIVYRFADRIVEITLEDASCGEPRQDGTGL